MTALADFDATVDALSGNPSSVKQGAKDAARVLVDALLHEQFEHIKLHIDAELAAATDPTDQRILQILSDSLATLEAKPDPHATDVSGLLAANNRVVEKWSGYLSAAMHAESSARVQRILSQGLSLHADTDVRTRLGRVRDAITAVGI